MSVATNENQFYLQIPLIFICVDFFFRTNEIVTCGREKNVDEGFEPNIQLIAHCSPTKWTTPAVNLGHIG